MTVQNSTECGSGCQNCADGNTANGRSVEIEFTLNGESQQHVIPTNVTLLDLLRDRCGKRGVRSSCERSVCGACTVLIDDVPVASCATFAFDVDGSKVETVESLEMSDGTLNPVQEAFRQCGGYQCGFCTSGMLMLTTGLLRENPAPERIEIRDWISSNTCRCTGYEMIMESVERAAELTREAGTEGAWA
ncbi:(2Fe-2S)-binding protein [Paeniglutamicibacter sulfureus]|uniref:(2Fe-2S)-binding protein n=1 Tax=Paeniglutamicibacter sulfureus TaxID=43666 RepID=UPI0026659793|nr:(2Fe-2S)-binding protein [Paeniglutamicibacter sulfureus]MDO2934631.1 (2Fe-2S)-binding protein [Paeniglutamicibacter sulfureus]